MGVRAFLARAQKSRLLSCWLFPLRVLSWFFYLICLVRKRWLLSLRQRRHLESLLVTVGNITVGGTGKTPFIMLLLSHLQCSSAYVSRGYRRREKGLAVGTGLRAEQIGDEASLVSRRFPSLLTAVDSCKWKAVQAVDGKVDVIVLDDGLQRYDVPRDVEIATVDCRCPDGYGALLPRGLLREGLSRLENVDYIVLTNADGARPRFDRSTIVTRPVIRRFFTPSGQTKELPVGQRVALFSSIAQPEAFATTIEKLGFDVVDELCFPDHVDINEVSLVEYSDRVHARYPNAVLLGTDKDWARRESWNGLDVVFSELHLEIIEGQELFEELLGRLNGECRDR